jgi:rod shape-determining protein MreD
LKLQYDKIESVFLIIGSLLLQAFLTPVIAINVWRPDLVLIVVILMGYRYGALAGTLIGFSLGIFQDSISVSPIGISSLANCIIGFLAGTTKGFRLGSYGMVLSTIILMLIHGLIFFAIYHLKTESTYAYLIVTRVFPNTIYTFIIWLVTSYFFKPLTDS